MQTSSTSVLERRVQFSGRLVTHPFEVGWATEARFFIQLSGNMSNVSFQTQISPDGLNWMAYGDPQKHEANIAMSSMALTNFGSWLRVVLTQEEPHHSVEALVHLTLKG